VAKNGFPGMVELLAIWERMELVSLESAYWRLSMVYWGDDFGIFF
jgi:hypothetical protein